MRGRELKLFTLPRSSSSLALSSLIMSSGSVFTLAMILATSSGTYPSLQVCFEKMSSVSWSSDTFFSMLTNVNLPEGEAEFFDTLNVYFPNIYDVKYLMKSCKNLKGGLQVCSDLEHAYDENWSFCYWVIPCEKMRFWTSGLKIGFFGPKQVSWTAWGASGPILASPSHLRVNFHSWVAFWVCRAPKVPNKLLIPFFVILLSFLHPKGWNKSTFDVQDPKPAINSKN